MEQTTFTVNRNTLQVSSKRTLNASRERVWTAYTNPKEITKWWGPRRFTTVIDVMDFKPGGTWRYIHRDPEGKEFAFNGVYKEIRKPEKLVSTFEYEAAPGHISTDTTLFTEAGGKTEITTTTQFKTLADLNGMVNSGMEVGFRESMDRLAELVEKNNN